MLLISFYTFKFHIKARTINLHNLDRQTQTLVRNVIGNAQITQLQTSHKWLINRTEFHSKFYDMKNIQNNYSVQFQLNNEIHYGNILNFITINGIVFCQIEKFTCTEFNFCCKFNNIAVRNAFANIHKFFIKYVVSNDIVLIDSANIKKKCILMKIENDCILSPCCYLEEHD